MNASMKVTVVRSMARDAISRLEEFRANNSGARAAQYVKVQGMLSFLDALHHSGTVILTQDDFLALTQLP